MPPRVAVIDIGSNTIKLLVAANGTGGPIETVHFAVDEARIGRGLGGPLPTLDPESIERGGAAVARFAEIAHEFGAARIVAVATSAVRDAANGAEFAEQVRRSTGLSIRILTGEEEANYIGRGLACDPALGGATDFYLFDLGGGSLECVEFRGKRATQETSLRLGCVRLAERCVADPSAPFTDRDRAAVVAAVDSAFAANPFRFTLPSPAVAVATGGTVTTVRAMLAAERGLEIGETDAAVTLAELEHLLARTAGVPLSRRREIAGLPAARADVFPTALATIVAVARRAGAECLRHSFYNLRYGVADELLSARGP